MRLCVCGGGEGCPIVAMDTPVCGKQSRHDRAEFTDSRWLGRGHGSPQRGVTMVPPLVLMGDTCNRISPRTPGGWRLGVELCGRPHGEMVHCHQPPQKLSCLTPQTCTKPSAALSSALTTEGLDEGWQIWEEFYSLGNTQKRTEIRYQGIEGRATSLSATSRCI